MRVHRLLMAGGGRRAFLPGKDVEQVEESIFHEPARLSDRYDGWHSCHPALPGPHDRVAPLVFL
ncbi:hypothetical protein CFR75_03725 [Komagataeibacter xylinus]|uniref:Uncharacterized protein n=1 Tax=Komagataeibacter xylinus TaxID=28448 RepID=A0A318PKR9_KOMXY|nr:hypothetical protein CFR75_03725 [Komagataeibacter xylinus]